MHIRPCARFRRSAFERRWARRPLTAWPVRSRVQRCQGTVVRKAGRIGSFAVRATPRVFKKRLREFGYVVGRDVTLDHRPGRPNCRDLVTRARGAASGLPMPPPWIASAAISCGANRTLVPDHLNFESLADLQFSEILGSSV
jgi:hypothetical protein